LTARGEEKKRSKSRTDGSISMELTAGNCGNAGTWGLKPKSFSQMNRGGKVNKPKKGKGYWKNGDGWSN